MVQGNLESPVAAPHPTVYKLPSVGQQQKPFSQQCYIQTGLQTSQTVYPQSFQHKFSKNFLMKFNGIFFLVDWMEHESIETIRIYPARSSDE